MEVAMYDLANILKNK
jgi:hypothetical protein